MRSRTRYRLERCLSRNASALVIGVLIAVVISLLQLGVPGGESRGGSSSNPASALDQWVHDLLLRARAPGWQVDPATGSNQVRDPRSFITIVAIDERTIAELGAYGAGYPRRYHAQLVEALLAAPPRVIAFDLGFFEPTPDDELLAAALDHARSLPVPTSIVLGAVGLGPRGESSAAQSTGELAFDSGLWPVPSLAARAELALANIVPDERGTIRSMPLVTSVDGVERPTLGLAATADYLRRPGVLDGRTGPTAQFAGRTIPLEKDAALRIGYFGPPSQAYTPGSTFRVISFVDVIRGRIDPATWRGGLVLVGALGATGLADDYWTPTSDQGRKMAGVEIHANVAATLFSTRFLREAPAPVHVGLILGISLLVAVVTAHLGALSAGVVSLLVLCAYAAADAWALYALGLLVPLATPLLGGLISFSAGAAHRFAIEQRQARRLRAQMAHGAVHDALTGLPNRTLLQHRLAQAIVEARQEAQSCALLLLGLDQFGNVNETLGHRAGDSLLVQLAHTLRANVTEQATIGRLDGAQFAVLLPGSDTRAATAVATRMIAALHSPIIVHGQEILLTPSVGVVGFPEHGVDPETLLRRGELAMHAARQARTDHAVYTAGQDGQAAERLALASALRRAIASGDELTLYFQPKVACDSGRVAGVEALTRWQHPQLGPIPADRFVALAEETGQIGSLTRWVLDSAVRQCRAWLDAGLEVQVAVNLSAMDVQDSGLPLAVADVLRRWDVPAALLMVEVTEGALLGDVSAALDVLHRLEAMGVGAALDDFGTGYSSLGYLKQFPVRELKIDRSFVADIVTEARDRTIVQSTIQLGHGLGLTVVAEGIEDAATLALVRELGCDLVQGYQPGRPMSAPDFESWLRNAPHARDSFSAAA